MLQVYRACPSVGRVHCRGVVCELLHGKVAFRSLWYDSSYHTETSQCQYDNTRNIQHVLVSRPFLFLVKSRNYPISNPWAWIIWGMNKWDKVIVEVDSVLTNRPRLYRKLRRLYFWGQPPGEVINERVMDFSSNARTENGIIWNQTIWKTHCRKL